MLAQKLTEDLMSVHTMLTEVFMPVHICADRDFEVGA